MRIAVLGVGRVGRAIALDLASEGHEVHAVDAFAEVLTSLEDKLAGTEVADLSASDEVQRIAGGCELVVCAVPGPMGFATMRAIIEAGTDVVDISFFEQDAFALNQLAVGNGVTAIVDCGLAPGLSNLILGRHHAEMQSVERFACYVGGLPVARKQPWEYAAPFSPIDVIAEYTRPARFRRDGEEVVMDALTEVEQFNITTLGTLEAFNSDGLRSLLRFTDIPNMVEKTMRYPGHADKVAFLRDSGLLDETPVEVNGAMVSPQALTARVLEQAWRFAPGEPDVTVMRVEVAGEQSGKPVTHSYDLIDHFDDEAKVSSMARTTGFTCCAAVSAYAQGLFKKPGVQPPEILGADEKVFRHMLEYLERRNIRFEVNHR